MKYVLTFCALTFTLFSASAQVPLLYYDFEAGSGTNILNQGSISTNGVLVGAAGDERWVAGASGGSSSSGGLELDGDNGVDGDKILTGLSTTPLGMNSQTYTASCWVNFQDLSGDRFVFGQLPAAGAWYHLGVRNARMHFGHHGADSGGATVLQPSTWYHLAFVYDSGVQIMYLDGTLDVAPVTRRELQVTHELVIGRSLSQSTIDGVIDEVAIWDSALSLDQVAFLAGGGSPTNVPPPATGLTGTFHTAPLGSNGTWNLYLSISAANGSLKTWYDAHEHARSVIDPHGGTGKPGHLVHVDSRVENNYLNNFVFPGGDFWIGLTDSETMGGSEAGTNPTNGWVWATNGVDVAQPVSFVNWGPGEPNDSGGEDVAHMRASGVWNDQRSNIPADNQTGAAPLAYVIEWETQSPTPVPNATILEPILPPSLPGPAGQPMLWGGLEVRGNGIIDSILAAVISLESGGGTIVTGYTPTVNFIDSGNFGTGGRFHEDIGMLGDLGGNDDDLAAVYKARIDIPVEGDHTFGVRCDDGFALRIRGATWSQTAGLADQDLSDPQTIFVRSGQGNNEALGTIHLLAGTYDVEFVTFERAGVAHWEVFSAPGVFTAENQTTDWRLVGHEATGNIRAPGLVDQGGFGWTVLSSAPGGPQLTNIFLASNEVFTAAVSTSFWNALNFHDPGFGGPGEIPGDVGFPTNAVGVGDDDFALLAAGVLDIPVDGLYYFGFRGDDGGAILIPGRNWERVTQTATAQALVTNDLLVCDCLNGNTRTVGEIFLPAGQHPIQALFWERGGGAYWEVFYEAATTPSTLLATGPGTVGADTLDGLRLVGSTTSGPPFAIRRNHYLSGPDTITLTWESVPAASYVIEASIDYVNWITLPDRVPSQGAETTTTIDDPALGPFTVFRVGRE